jgi:hypothetical protein
MRLPRMIVAGVVVLVLVAPAATAAADRSAREVTLAVIGDVPYGVDQEAIFGNLIAAVNDDPKVRTVVHVGDIKNGSAPCTDERLLAVRSAFDTFKDPVVYTPGDNEWTDCHRPAAGGYDPLERLRTLRLLFFSEPGDLLGRHPGTAVAQAGYPENVRWTQSRVMFAALHVVGSDNGLAPWTGNLAPTATQTAEVEARVAATVEWVDAAFDEADETGAIGVVLLMQADTFPTSQGQQDVVDRIATRTASFDGPVLLVQGDSHTYLVDQPLPLENLTRIVVHGETLPFEYLRLTIDPRDLAVFHWERVPVATAPG